MRLFRLTITPLELPEMKQIATGVHFLSLFLTGFMYILEHEWTKCVGLTSAVAWCLAMFIPPTGLIRPDDAPEYAKNGMSYLPNRDGMGAAGLKLGTEEALKKHPSSKRGGKKKRS